jgi:MarR family transcriptional regulator, organic hydroperoxide resistance regulator
MADFQSKFKSAELSPGFLLWKASNLHQKLQRKALLEVDLTPSQFSILACYFFLSSKSSSVTQTDVCRHAGIDKMLISDLTKTLIKKKCLKKIANKNDRRSYSIKLTENGEDKCNQALKIIEPLDAKFFATATDPKNLIRGLADLVAGEHEILI